uniref:Aminotransferase class I/classII domain-containing protein n=1 Tax=Bionectria ochroleuca TaxID=29856 RepID=A0A8H7KDS3_BIOOC
MACLILEDELWINDLMERAHKTLQRANDMTRAALDIAGIWYERRVTAGFYLWLECSEFLPQFEDKWKTGEALFRRMAEGGVGLSAGGIGLGAEKPGNFRLVFAHSGDVLKIALKRLITVLKGAEVVEGISILKDKPKVESRL